MMQRFGRGNRRPLLGRVGAAGGRRTARLARRSMAEGNYQLAAELFEEMAQTAAARGFQQHAPLLLLKAGRAKLHSGQLNAAMDLIFQGLQGFAAADQPFALERAGRRVVIELRQLGFEPAAVEVEQWLAGQNPEASAPTSSATSTPQRLPTNCPQCGASLRPDEVEWFDDRSAECPYCASVVQSQ